MDDQPKEKVPTSPGERTGLFCMAWVIGIFGICLVRLIGFVQDNAVDLLVDDQWDALRPLFEDRRPLDMFFMQHGPPRLGLGGLISWALYHTTSWDVRAEAWAGVGCFASPRS